MSIKDLEVKFRVRGRILTAIRNISLDIYENETIAIVGESGSGKSVFTKTFAGMLDSNGFISNGSIIFSDDELSKTTIKLNAYNRRILRNLENTLNKYSPLERGASEYRAYLQKKTEIREAMSLTEEEEESFKARIKEADDKAVDLQNYVLTLDKHDKKVQEEYRTKTALVAEYKATKANLTSEMQALAKARKAEYTQNKAKVASDKKELAEFLKLRDAKIATPEDKNNKYGIKTETMLRNRKISREILLSIGRYPRRNQIQFISKLKKSFKTAMALGEDLNDPQILNKVFETAVFRVEFRNFDEQNGILEGYAIIDCAKVKYNGDWTQIRGRRIATVFQDPMTSLNPIITIGKQITSVIIKHQKCSETEARIRALELMHKVGIPNAQARFDDYPFQYSGGMRQRIVIAIALSCRPKILICDEPTTALDVTIQAQILKLIKDLQKEFGYTIVFITHDLGVVANVADRVAVMYAGQIIEIGKVDEVFYDPKHPYTWALLSSLPQLAERNTVLYSITGTPPSLYNKIIGDPFAPRNPYCMKIDTIKEPPMFKVTDTHYAKTWLLDPRAPEMHKPEIIENIHEKLIRAFNID